MQTEITLTAGKVRVEFVKAWNAGRCYNKAQFLVYAGHQLSEADIDQLEREGHIGWGQELEVRDNRDGSWLITRGRDSSD